MTTRKDTDSRRVLDAIRRIVRELRLSARDAETDAGLSAAQLFVLQCLCEGGSLSMGQLAERTHTDPSSVSVVVRRLHEAGLVTRTRPPEDERRVEIAITSRGRSLVTRAPDAAQHRLVSALERLGAARRQKLSELLQQLVQEMGIEDDGAAPMFFESEPTSSARRRRHAR